LNKNYRNFWIILPLAGYPVGYPVIRPYRIAGRAIWYPAGYRISKPAGYLAGRISGASLVKVLSYWEKTKEKRPGGDFTSRKN
jgi:hypothetical protein